MRNDTGAIFIVTDTSLRYLRPARLDDSLEVTVGLSRRSYTRLSFVQQVWRGPDLLTEGHIGVACVNAGTFRPRALPNDLLKSIE